ncbi:hypothetical protein DFS33DRAFT_1447412 [Desarmillaria ectypa]|nr:hypothetical protein DFS33DRAFT_1447412 [Desarmillaria ectypa]
MCDPASNPLKLTLPVLSPSSSDCAINAVRRAYHKVFGGTAPADEWDNQFLLWTQVCSASGVHHRLVQEIRKDFPSLPDPTQWDVGMSWGAMPLFDLPLALQKNIPVSKTIDVVEFMKHLRSDAELPEPCKETPGREAILHRREQLITAICHALLSHVGFNIASKYHKASTKKLELSQDTSPYARVLSYSIEPVWRFSFVVQTTDGAGRPASEAVPNVVVSMIWRYISGSTDVWSQTAVSWILNSDYFLDERTTFPPQFNRIEDTGFRSTARFMEFVQKMQERLLKPLWQNILDNHPDVGSTDHLSKQKSHEQSLEETKTTVHDTQQEQGVGELAGDNGLFSEEQIQMQDKEAYMLHEDYVVPITRAEHLERSLSPNHLRGGDMAE